MIWTLPITYLLGMLFWLACLAAMVAGLLRWRREAKRKTAGRFTLGVIHAGLSGWMVLALLTAAELIFALFVDQSDAINMTNVSKRWMERHIDGQVNNIGFRDAADFPRDLPEGVHRICFVGDSFTVGHGIRNMADRFSDRVGRALEEAHPGKYVVANLGWPGYETSQLEALVRATLTLGNDVGTVIYVFVLNDIEGYDERTQAALESIERTRPRSFLFTKTYFFNWLYFRYVQASSPGVVGYFPHLLDAYDSPAWDGLRRKLDQFKRTCDEFQVDFRMVIFPFVHNLGPEYPFRPVHAKLVRYCREAGIPVLDLEPVLTPHAAAGLTVHRFDAHPNERAHRLAAQAIQRKLLADLFNRPNE